MGYVARTDTLELIRRAAILRSALREDTEDAGCFLVSWPTCFDKLRFIGRGKKALAHPSPLPLNNDS